MGKKRTRLTTKEEIGFVRSYIEKKISSRNWPSEETQSEALADFKKRPICGRYAHDELIWWCNQWLSDAQWRQFKNTLNSWRFRQKTQEPPKRIQLTSPAWKIISTLAQMENKTISSFIVDKLGAEYKQVLERDIPR